MLTLVAAVLAYDIARETCDLLSSIVDADDSALGKRARSVVESLKVRSCMIEEKDMVSVADWQVVGE